MQTSSEFLSAISLAYLSVCLVWLSARRWLSDCWPQEQMPETDRKWLDLSMIPLAAVGTFLLGECYRRDWLLPNLPGSGGYLSTAVNLCIPFLPLVLIVLTRRQSGHTVMLSTAGLGYKLGVGLIAAIVGVAVYLTASGEWMRLAEVLNNCVSPHALAHAPAVFLEGVAVAFAYDRLRWVIGGPWSIWIPCLLFAAAHIPRSLDAGRPPLEVVVWFVFNTVLPALIFTVVARSRDVIWIAIPHYVLDVAIGTFR